ncbi:hypothetical protein [Pseudonocardia adelaidensis]|uniref:Uncharacterized protein n=1 Tax=Pseudonocardia adelaidensis TaxID=648754 RepID=A0ABP9NE99_9PSEU
MSASPAQQNHEWRDELVELHVLAANGDSAAASAAERRMADDPAFRKAWTEVQAACDKVNASADPGR